MPLFVAMSSLQGLTQSDAFASLSALPVDGIQLTPGNLPSPDFRERVRGYAGLVRFHHSFSWDHYRAVLYDERGLTPRLTRDWSLHPPSTKLAIPFVRWLEGALSVDALCEVMYPGYRLGADAELAAALSGKLRLALDISHLHILMTQAQISAGTLRRLLDYEKLDEVHVSHNEGRADSHRPLCARTPWLDWARERLRGGTPVIYESRMHDTSIDWKNQLESLR
jgi:hypothetical protein